MTQAVKQGAPLAAALQQSWWRSLIWVPTLYLAEGIPYNVINGTSLRMYKALGLPDGQITVAVGSIGVAWSLKPFWAAFLDMYRTKKFFVLSSELLIGLVFVAVSMSLPLPNFFQVSIALLWVAALGSATQDICADGVYLTTLDERSQARMAGIQGTFWVLGKILAAGVLISVLDKVKTAQGWSEHRMWTTVMLVAGCAMFLLAAYHFWFLPTGSIKQRPENSRQVVREFWGTVTTFFHKRAFWGMIAFVFLYRLGEGLILMEGQLFLQSDVANGGLGLSAGQVSDIDAVYGTTASIIGGLLGGMFASKLTLPRALGILGLCLNVPHFTYVFLSQAASGNHGLDHATIVALVSIEKFGYGFGFIGNMIYMMQQLAPGRSTMTHYAFATSLMNIMLVPTNMISGPLAELLGFSTFFLVVMFASIPSAWAAFKAPFPIKAEEIERIQTEGARGQDVLTVDDASRLTEPQRAVQALAGRASFYAMLGILAILVIDAACLGNLKSTPNNPHPSVLWFVALLANLALKGYLVLRAFQLGKQTFERAAQSGETLYAANAKGANVAASLCVAGSALVLFVGVKLAF